MIKQVSCMERAEKNAAFVIFHRKAYSNRHSDILDHILVAVRGAGDFGFPGGRVDAGEPIIDAAVREVREEIGYTVDPDKLEPLCSHKLDDGSHTHVFTYEVECLADVRNVVATDELAGLNVVALTETSIANLKRGQWCASGLLELRYYLGA